MAADRRRRFGDFDADVDADVDADLDADLDAAFDADVVDDPDAGAVFGVGGGADAGRAPTDDRRPRWSRRRREGDRGDVPADDLLVTRKGPWSRFVQAGVTGVAGASPVGDASLRTRRARSLVAAFTAAGVDTADARARHCIVVDVRSDAPACSGAVHTPNATVDVAEIRFRGFDAATWHRLADVFATSAATGAALLDGRMPDDADALTAVVGRRLVPEPDDVVETTCTCGDGAAHCVHVAALAAELTRHVDDDPLVLFALRGMPAPAFLDALRERRRVLADTGADPAAASVSDPVAADPVRFWSAGPLPPAAPPPPPRGDAAAVLDEAPVAVVVGTGLSGDVTFDDLVRGAYPGIRRAAMARMRRSGG